MQVENSNYRNPSSLFNRSTAPVREKRPFDTTNNKGRGYSRLWAVYPDYWPVKWGEVPTLGYVRADNEFDAKYAAYDRGMSHPNNCSFGLKLVLQDRNPEFFSKHGYTSK